MVVKAIIRVKTIGGSKFSIALFYPCLYITGVCVCVCVSACVSVSVFVYVSVSVSVFVFVCVMFLTLVSGDITGQDD